MNYCATGTDAFRYGVFAVACGMYDTVLVVGFDKPKDRGVSGPSVDDAPACAACRRRRPAGSRCAPRATSRPTAPAARTSRKIAVKNHHNGTLAPKSMLKREITVEEHAEGAHDLVALRPLRLRRADPTVPPPRSSPRASSAKGFRDDYVLVKAVASQAGPNPQKDPEHRLPALEADRDGREAGLRPGRHHQSPQGDPRRPGARLLHADRAAVVRRPRLLREGLGQGAHRRAAPSSCGGELPVNTDGGLKTFGHPTGATGVRMLYENYKQLQGKRRQAPGEEPDAGAEPQHRRRSRTACGIAIIGI